MNKAHDILELIAPQVASAEVYNVASESVKVGFKAGKLVASEVQEISGVSLRAINENRLGFYSTTDLSDTQALQEGILNSVKYGGEANFEFVASSVGTDFNAYSSETARLDIQELAEMGRGLGEQMAAYADDVVCSYDLTRTVMNTQLVNSRNLNLKEQRSSLNLGLRVQRVRGDDVFMLWTGHSAIGPEADFGRLVDKVIERLRQAETLTTLETLSSKNGKLPVIFAPASLGLLIGPLIAGLNGKNCALGVSPLSDKLGEQIFDLRFSLQDDPFLANRTGSTAFDDEGTPTVVSHFIESGTVNGFYYDLKTAGEAGKLSTGHGLRQPENTRLGQPAMALHNLTVEAGTTPLAEILKGIDEGLLVESVLGMGQTNVLAGSFSNSVQVAYRIRNGEIVGRVKDVSVAGNVYELLKLQLGGISQEREVTVGSQTLPYILIDDVSVAAKQ